MKRTILAALAILLAGTSASLAVEKLKVAIPQKEFKGALAKLQETREKHRKLSEMAAPGALFSDAFGLLQQNLKDHPEVYLIETTLQVEDANPTYGFWHPKLGVQGGYQERAQSSAERAATMKVVGQVSAGTAPEKVFNDFVQACKLAGSTKGLMVRTSKTFDAAKRQFEFEISPGTSFRPKGTDATVAVSPWMLRRATLLPAEGSAAPEMVAVHGVDLEGVENTVSKDQIDEKDWARLLETLPKSAVKSGEGN